MMPDNIAKASNQRTLCILRDIEFNMITCTDDTIQIGALVGAFFLYKN